MARSHADVAADHGRMPTTAPAAGKIVSWLKQPGDKVKKGESIVVVESDKADMDVESFSEGILGAIVIPEGGVATVGSPIAYIAESEADLSAAKEKAGEWGQLRVAQVVGAGEE